MAAQQEVAKNTKELVDIQKVPRPASPEWTLTALLTKLVDKAEKAEQLAEERVSQGDQLNRFVTSDVTTGGMTPLSPANGG